MSQAIKRSESNLGSSAFTLMLNSRDKPATLIDVFLI
jgi:hypothetical protein